MYNLINITFYSQFTEKHWKSATNRRSYFIKFAIQNRFDPLVAESWENIKRKEMIKQVKRMREREGER